MALESVYKLSTPRKIGVRIQASPLPGGGHWFEPSGAHNIIPKTANWGDSFPNRLDINTSDYINFTVNNISR